MVQDETKTGSTAAFTAIEFAPTPIFSPSSPISPSQSYQRENKIDFSKIN